MRITPVKRWPALAAALLVFVVAAAGLALAQHPAKLALPRQAAVRASLHSPLTSKALGGARWDSVTVTAIDRSLARVSFFDHGQIEAQVAVRRNGTVAHGEGFSERGVPYGDWIAYQPALLIGLGVLFLLVAGVAPWRRMRNLDVVAGLSLVGPVLLLQHRYVSASVLSALPGLGYLLVRCGRRGLGQDGAPAPVRPLLDALTPGWDARQRVRLLRALLAALALVFAMVTISSREAVDVVYAVMEGATKLTSGVLPYGHLPGDVIHGDTYPLLSFVLYAPLAWISPVHSTWSSVDLGLGAAVAAALATAWTLSRIVTSGRRSGPEPRREPELEAAGLRAALAWLTFPAVLAAVSTGTTDVVLAVMLVVALLLWRRPALATGLLAAAAWFKLAPAVLVPVRLASLRGRRLALALLVIVAVSLPLLALLVALGGPGGLAAMVHAMTFQFSRSSPQSIWSALGLQALQPVGEAAGLALIAGAAVRLRAQPGLQEDRGRMAALLAAILIALQLAAGYWAFLYLLWVVPLVSVSLLVPAEGLAEPARERQAFAPLRSRVAEGRA